MIAAKRMCFSGHKTAQQVFQGKKWPVHWQIKSGTKEQNYEVLT